MGRNQGDFTCPICGGRVYANALACPHCGADERSGWRDDADEIDAASSLGIDDPDDFDYEAFVAEEFGEGRAKSAVERFWWLVAVLVLVAFALVFALAR